MVLLSGRLPPIIVNEWAIWAELRIGSFVMILIVPAIADEPNKAAEKPDVTIDYGESELYTKEELDDAIAVIEAEFSTWEGCELHSLTYGGDDACSEENVAWMNELRDEETSPEPFTQCVLFESSFHSPVEQRDAWDADTEYEGWQWWLARSEGGAWTLLTWGY